MAKVFMLDFGTPHKNNFIELLSRLVAAGDGTRILKKGAYCAIKAHFGEDGNVNYVHPLYVRKLTEIIRSQGVHPFLTDTTTLYSGRRFRADTHIALAREHGFDFAPVVIADGLLGDEFEERDGMKFGRVFGSVESMFVVSHFKGHMLTGFGAAIKNVGMGCAAKGGKLAIHSRSRPAVNEDKCAQCLRCLEYCAFQAIERTKNSVRIDDRRCTGCGGCLALCPERAIKFSWSAGASEVQKAIAAHAAAFVKNKKIFYMNFLTGISPECDCFHSNEPLIHPDVGILAGFDPVALDQASYDLVKRAINRRHPEIDPEEQLFYAEKFAAGERRYEIKKI